MGQLNNPGHGVGVGEHGMSCRSNARATEEEPRPRIHVQKGGELIGKRSAHSLARLLTSRLRRPLRGAGGWREKRGKGGEWDPTHWFDPTGEAVARKRVGEPCLYSARDSFCKGEVGGV